MTDDNFHTLTGEALEEQIADTVKALREGKSVIANCIFARGVGIKDDGNGRFTVHLWPVLDSPDRPMTRNMFPAPRTETAGWPNAVLPPKEEDLEATMRLAKTARGIRQRLEDPKSDFNVLLDKNRELEAARKARAVPQPPQEPTSAEVEAAAAAIRDWSRQVGLRTAEQVACAVLAAARKARVATAPQEPTPEAVERAAVRVKPLEWEHLGGNTYRAAAPLFGNLRVERYGTGNWHAAWSVPGSTYAFVEGEFPSHAAAMAAAQAEYDRRILSALTAPA